MDLNLLNDIRIDRENDLPLYAQLRDALRELILNRFHPGDAFYSDTILMEHLPVSQITVRRALAELAKDGYVTRRAGAGSVVAHTYKSLLLHDEQSPGETSGARLLPMQPKSLYRGAGVHTISIISASIDSEMVMSMTDALRNIVESRGFLANVLLERTAADAYARILQPPEDEAVILFRFEKDVVLLYDALSSRGYRTVAIDAIPAGYKGSAVQTDPAAAVAQGVDHLTSLGHERIVLLVNEPAAAQNVLDKVAAFERIAQISGRSHSFRVVIVPPPFNNSYTAAYEIMPEIWRDDHTRPTAIMTVSDPGAWAAVKWLAQHSVAVPGQVSVLGFEDAMSSKFMHPSLSTIAHPIDKIARRALDILCSEDRPVIEKIAPELVIRETTGPVAGA